MKPHEISTCLVTNELDAIRDFFVNILGGKINFDCGWYVNIEFGDPRVSLQFMEPQSPDMPVTNGQGIIFNILVDDVDAQYQAMVDKNQTIAMPLEEHPWGDKGFAIVGPLGVQIYIYTEAEPDEEFKQYYID